jgi:hypothetical protein
MRRSSNDTSGECAGCRRSRPDHSVELLVEVSITISYLNEAAVAVNGTVCIDRERDGVRPARQMIVQRAPQGGTSRGRRAIGPNR